MAMTRVIWAQALRFESPIRPELWAVLALVPLGILLLYFLKLRRRSVQVPSTLLWRKSLEDLQVNSPFQKLRRNLLLLLQLLAVGLVMLALLGPKSQGLGRQGKRLVLAIDESASMAASDVEPTRLDQALRKARTVIEEMKPEDLAMIIAFSNSARVVTNYTQDRSMLLSRLGTIKPTDRSTSLREALQLVAGLANPQKYLEPGEGQEAATFVPPKLLIFTDGGFTDVENFSLGSIEPEVVPIGPPINWTAVTGPPGGAGNAAAASAIQDAGATSASSAFVGPSSDNLALLSLSTGREESRPEQLLVFGRVRNHRAEPVSTRVVLYRQDSARSGEPGTVIDALALELPARGDQAFQFELKADSPSGEFLVKLEEPDALAIDNQAYAVSNAPRRSRVLLVSEGNRFLTDTLTTPASAQIAELTSMRPEQLELPENQRSLQDGSYDLVIFEGVTPKVQPESSVLYLGALPPDISADQGKPVTSPVIIDWDLSHPILQFVRDLGTVAIQKAVIVEPPTGARLLIETDQGVLGYARPRGSYLDVVIGFPLMDGPKFNTNWPLKSGFPLFVLNCLKVLGNAVDTSASDRDIYSTDQPVTLRLETAAEQVEIVGPDGKVIESCQKNSQGTFVVSQAQQAGIYHASWGTGPNESAAFAVNLFNERESNLAPRGQVPPGLTDAQADAYRIKIGATPVQSLSVDAPVTREWWRLLVVLALGMVMFEWWVYNRRLSA